MTLRDLEARLVRRKLRPGRGTIWTTVRRLEQAEGVWFMCPRCFERNNGRVGTHWVMCWSPEVPQSEDPKSGRWRMVGTGLHDLSLVGDPSSSVKILGGCEAHFFVEGGTVRAA